MGDEKNSEDLPLSELEKNLLFEEGEHKELKVNIIEHEDTVDEEDNLTGWSNTSTTDQIEDDLKQQCIDLKKQIYERWEKSILRKTKFSPVVAMRDKTVDSQVDSYEAKHNESVVEDKLDSSNIDNVRRKKLGIRWKQYDSEDNIEPARIETLPPDENENRVKKDEIHNFVTGSEEQSLGASIQDIYANAIDFRKQRGRTLKESTESENNVDYMEMVNKGQSSRIENLRHLRNFNMNLRTSDNRRDVIDDRRDTIDNSTHKNITSNESSNESSFNLKSAMKRIPPPFPLYDTSTSSEKNNLASYGDGNGKSRAQEEMQFHNQHYIPPKTGISIPMITPPPMHLHHYENIVEPILPLRPNIVSDMLMKDAQRVANSEQSMNRVVFDSIEMNPEFGSNSIDEGVKVGEESIPVGNLGDAAKVNQRTLKPYLKLNGPEDTTLLFESRFESGNLRRAIQISEFEYDLVAKPDINTRGHTQWYYFQVKNTRKNTKYKFNMINLLKPDSLYNQGMRPVLYSVEDEKRGIGWRRYGTEICYYQNHIKRKGSGNYYTFTFTIEFPHDNDTVYLAYCYPYTYTDLQRYLAGLEADPKRRNRFRRRTLCQSLAGNNCDLLTVTSFACDPEALKTRKGVVVTGRVHPGETNASWMMKGLIDYLTGPSLDAKILRDNFVFKIVPMLNVDGVIVGNYRCSLAGVDLNRNWLDPSRKLHPTIFYTKQMMKRFASDREVILYTDLHGHSRKMNIFMYGCSETAKQRAQSLANAPEGVRKKVHQRLSERIFPRILWRNSTCFSFSDCSFRIQKQKETTARVVVFRELNLTNTYTMEASFCGADFGRLQNVHFSTTHYEEMGHYFCDTILDYCDPDQSKVQSTLRELEMLYPRQSSGKKSSSSSNVTNTAVMNSESSNANTGLTGPDDQSDTSAGSDYDDASGKDSKGSRGRNKSDSSSSIARKKSRSRGRNGSSSSSNSTSTNRKRSRSKSSKSSSNSNNSSVPTVPLAVQSLDINRNTSDSFLYAANSSSRRRSGNRRKGGHESTTEESTSRSTKSERKGSRRSEKSRSERSTSTTTNSSSRSSSRRRVNTNSNDTSSNTASPPPNSRAYLRHRKMREREAKISIMENAGEILVSNGAQPQTISLETEVEGGEDGVVGVAAASVISHMDRHENNDKVTRRKSRRRPKKTKNGRSSTVVVQRPTRRMHGEKSRNITDEDLSMNGSQFSSIIPTRRNNSNNTNSSHSEGSVLGNSSEAGGSLPRINSRRARKL